MPQILLNDHPFRMPTEMLAGILETFNVRCERKRNGNVWAKRSSTSWRDFNDVQRAVYNIVREHGKPDLSEIDYAFFDHSAWYTAEDGATVSVCNPYWSDFNWPALIPLLWERGYYVFMYAGVVFVRKRRSDDEMFQVDPGFCYRDLDFSRFLRGKGGGTP